jgi:hypothetical protein
MRRFSVVLNGSRTSENLRAASAAFRLFIGLTWRRGLLPEPREVLTSLLA